MPKKVNSIPAILYLLIAVLSGILVHYYAGIRVKLTVLLIIGALLFFLLIPKISLIKRAGTFFSIACFSWFFCLGLYLSESNNSVYNEDYFGKYLVSSDKFLAKVIEPPVEKERSIKCQVEIYQNEQFVLTGRSLIYIQKDSAAKQIKYGDILCFQTWFNEIRANGNPHEFDYRRYLGIHNVHHQGYVKSENWQALGNEGNPVFSAVFQLRSYLSDLLAQSNLSKKNLMVANALLLGQKEYLDKDVLRSFSSAGAMHVLAVSGLHVGIVMLLLMFVLSPLKKWRNGKTLFLIITLAGIWSYALITGLSPSVLRASVMFSFIVVGKELQRDTSIYQSILVSAFLLIIIDPLIIFQVGFQLSYLAVIGIVYLQPKISNLFYVKNSLLDKMWQITAVSIAAQLATFPLGLYYFHQFPNFFMISNLIVIPLAFALLIIGLVYFLFHWLPFLSDGLLYLFDLLLTTLNEGVSWIQNLPYSIVWGISVSWYEVLLLYLLIIICVQAFIKKSFRLVFSGSLVLITFLILRFYQASQIESENKLFVYNISDETAIDVFQGSNNIFYASNELYTDEEKMLFHVKHNWFFRTGNEEPSLFVNIDNGTDYISFGDQVIFRLNESSLLELEGKFPMTDIILVESIQYIPENIVKIMAVSDAQIILGSNIGYNLKSFLKSELSGKILHDLKQDGAFEKSF